MQVSRLQRTLCTAVTNSAQLLSRQHALDSEAVHNARKALKRARAGLRLLRDAENRSFYISDNARLRDAAKPLGRLRDEVVLLEKVGGIRSKATGGVNRKLLAALQHRIEADCRRLHTEARDARLPQAKAKEILDVAGGIKRRPLAHQKSGAILAGLKRIYRKGRAAMKLAGGKPTDLNLHEARKQSKYLFHALELVMNDGGDRARKLLKRSKSVGEKLGDDHDLVLLEERLSKLTSQPSRARTALSNHLDKHRRKLQKKAFRRARVLYAKKPKAFAALLASNLD
ncbi:MAG: domain containing protein [Betaproteobacteria bacterium]|nr:domain containing protein [Betaproteobacteria bacterium]